MAISLFTGDTVTTSSTEFSLVSGAAYNSGTTFSTSDGVYQLFLDTSDMAVGEEVQVRIYEKVRSGDTQRIVYQVNLFGPQSSGYVFPALVLMHGWDMTVDAIAGTADIGYAIKKVA